MDDFNLSVITIYSATILSGWLKIKVYIYYAIKIFIMSVTISIFKKVFFKMLHHLAYESRRNLVLHQNRLTFYQDRKKY